MQDGLPALAARALSDLGMVCRCKIVVDRLICECLAPPIEHP
jgi:hypothetical protein